MAVEAVIGSAFTFQVLFTDANGAPVVVADPSILIYHFSLTGVKQELQAATVMDAVTPAETGRYTNVYTIPSALDDGMTIYGEMTATDPGDPTNTFRVVQDVSIIASTRAWGGIPQGMRSEFVEGG